MPRGGRGIGTLDGAPGDRVVAGRGRSGHLLGRARCLAIPRGSEVDASQPFWRRGTLDRGIQRAAAAPNRSPPGGRAAGRRGPRWRSGCAGPSGSDPGPVSHETRLPADRGADLGSVRQAGDDSPVARGRARSLSRRGHAWRRRRPHDSGRDGSACRRGDAPCRRRRGAPCQPVLRSRPGGRRSLGESP